MKPFISGYNNGNLGKVAQYRSSSCSETTNMWKSAFAVCFVFVLTAASPVRQKDENLAKPIHIIKPPVRCPEGMKPDANGRCRVVWERSVDGACPEGLRPDEDGICREAEETPDCVGDECLQLKSLKKRDVEEGEGMAEAMKPLSKHRKMEALKNEKRNKRRRDADDGKAAKQARSKHAFIMMLKKKKMQMMKPKPPPHHPPHHHPPHHPGGAPQDPEEEEPEEEEEQPEQPDQPQALRLFFGDEACVEGENSTGAPGAAGAAGGCPPDAEIVADADANKEFKEWQPEKSSASSESSSSSSSSSSDSTGESESEGGSGESEDEVLEKAIKIKLMKLFRMKQRYGPALRRWLATQLREYEDSLDE